MSGNETGYKKSDLKNVLAIIVNPRHKSYTGKSLIMTRQFCLPPLCWWATFTTPYLQQSASDDGTPGPRSFTLYTSPYVPLPILWISSKSSCGFRRDRSTLEFIMSTAGHGAERERRRSANGTRKQVFWGKTYGVRKSQPGSNVAPTWLPVCAGHARWAPWRSSSPTVRDDLQESRMRYFFLFVFKEYLFLKIIIFLFD